jgi:hypothetical protein
MQGRAIVDDSTRDGGGTTNPWRKELNKVLVNSRVGKDWKRERSPGS